MHNAADSPFLFLVVSTPSFLLRRTGMLDVKNEMDPQSLNLLPTSGTKL
jgi:hypothetical protein